MNPTQRTELRKLREAATQGEWKTEKPAKNVDGWTQGVGVASTGIGNTIYANPPGGSFPFADKNLIVAAVNALPSLLDQIDRLEAQVAEYAEMERGGIAVYNDGNDHIRTDEKWRAARDTITKKYNPRSSGDSQPIYTIEAPSPEDRENCKNGNHKMYTENDHTWCRKCGYPNKY